MTKPLLPPQYVNIPTTLAYADLPRAVIVTGLRITGLAWQYHYERTDPIATADLCAVCDISRSQLYDHLSQLLDAEMLQYTKVSGQFIFTFHRPRPCPVFRTDRALSAAGYPDTESSDVKQQQYCHGFGFEGGCGGDAAQSRFPDWAQRLELLDDIGIREPARSEIAALDHATAQYLDSWATWFCAQTDLGVGALIAQLRAGVPAPDSQRDYISGAYSQYIQHYENSMKTRTAILAALTIIIGLALVARPSVADQPAPRTPTPSAVPEPTETQEPIATPTSTPVDAPTETPPPTPIPAPTETPTSTPVDTATPVATAIHTVVSPLDTPTAVPDPPTATPQQRRDPDPTITPEHIERPTPELIALLPQAGSDECWGPVVLVFVIVIVGGALLIHQRRGR